MPWVWALSNLVGRGAESADLEGQGVWPGLSCGCCAGCDRRQDAGRL